jgi:Xaa-Pro aminopeptidase
MDASDLIRQLRIIKSPVELEFMRKSGECADKGWEAMRDAARPGVRELEIALECDYAVQYHGAESGPHVLIGSGNWKYKSGPNYLSGGTRTLKAGDIILNEITPCYGGYYTQLLRPISLGPPDDDFKQLFDVHLEMYETARAELRAGASYEDIERKAKEVGFKLGKGRFAENVWTLETCEVSDTSLSKIKGELKPGMCFTLHPWTLDAQIREGSLGVVRGHTVGDSFIVTENGNECLSKLSHELTIIT